MRAPAEPSQRVDCIMDNGDDWWGSATMMEENDEIWSDPLMDKEDEPYLLPLPAYSCTVDDGKADAVDVTEACTTDDEEDNTLGGMQDADGDFWMENFEEGDSIIEALEKDTLPNLVALDPAAPSDDRWMYLASDEFLCLDLMDDGMKNELPLLEVTRETHQKPTVSSAQELDEHRARLAASMRATQKSRRDCWNRSFAKQSDLVLQQRHPQVTRVLAKIAESTATVQKSVLATA